MVKLYTFQIEIDQQNTNHVVNKYIFLLFLYLWAHSLSLSLFVGFFVLVVHCPLNIFVTWFLSIQKKIKCCFAYKIYIVECIHFKFSHNMVNFPCDLI